MTARTYDQRMAAAGLAIGTDVWTFFQGVVHNGTVSEVCRAEGRTWGVRVATGSRIVPNVVVSPSSVYLRPQEREKLAHEVNDHADFLRRTAERLQEGGDE